jgi:ABC-2 type transport system ATP-binding protein
MAENAICIENLTRDFKTVRAIDHLSLEIPAGSVFGFLGPNGAGKTTVIRLLLGLLEPTQGRASVLGFDTIKQADHIREKTGALLEHTGLYERLTAEDNLEFYARVWCMNKADRQARIKELLEHLGLWQRRKERIKTWSRGMKQKLAVARTLLHHPAVIFLDEPTAGFDPVSAVAFRENLARLAQQEGVTIFLATHNLAEAEKLCTLVGVLKEGKLLTVGHPDTLRRKNHAAEIEVTGPNFTEEFISKLRIRPEIQTAEHQNGRLRIHLNQGHTFSPVLKFMVEHNIEIEEIHQGKASLEDIFLTLMEEEK